MRPTFEELPLNSSINMIDMMCRYKGNRVNGVSSIMLHVRRREGMTAAAASRYSAGILLQCIPPTHVSTLLRSSPSLMVDGAALCSTLTKMLYTSVVTVDDIYIVPCAVPVSCE